MAKIILRDPTGPYKAFLDTEAMQVDVEEAYLGVGFTTMNDEKLSVCMRDSGFEIVYSRLHTAEGVKYGFDTGLIELKGGKILQRNETLFSAGRIYYENRT